eukprot:TRINITY_DN58021_c0_g1_i1.p1 TRINITY_DN58021_c0_g1~~TRINITY_DN58021_c0_g1_i1.p1  ORF type:complete len:316 (+),score=32.05 TRINITY_DN58021_c0_g1_i1:68-1015(+)
MQLFVARVIEIVFVINLVFLTIRSEDIAADDLELWRFVSRCERRLGLSCGDVNSFYEPFGACPGPSQTLPPPATTLFRDTTAASLGLLGRSLRFGRVLWCLAQLPSSHIVLELFAGTGGGSTLVLTHSLAQKQEGVLHSFERDVGNVAHALHVMQAFNLRSRALVAASGDLLLASPTKLRTAVADEAQRGLWLWYGDALASVSSLKGDVSMPSRSSLQALCEALPRVDLLVIDPQGTDFSRELFVAERSCRPRLFAIHNANLPEVGWVRTELLSRHRWREIANGSHPSPWAQEDQERNVSVRSWSVLLKKTESIT